MIDGKTEPRPEFVDLTPTQDGLLTTGRYFAGSILDDIASRTKEFGDRAKTFILAYLKSHGPTPGEDLTIACVAAGIEPRDLRQFGPVYMALQREGWIHKVGEAKRRFGHGSSGGKVYAYGHPPAPEPKE